FFLDKYWPEIEREDLRLVLEEYAARQRRFGR
ncbi:MAG: UDP diphosphate synthase, partial [Thermoproteus sp.]